ncbi:MAG: hypothetical protein WDW36_000111 [Sanguina aurantia]
MSHALFADLASPANIVVLRDKDAHGSGGLLGNAYCNFLSTEDAAHALHKWRYRLTVGGSHVKLTLAVIQTYKLDVFGPKAGWALSGRTRLMGVAVHKASQSALSRHRRVLALLRRQRVLALSRHRRVLALLRRQHVLAASRHRSVSALLRRPTCAAGRGATRPAVSRSLSSQEVLPGMCAGRPSARPLQPSPSASQRNATLPGGVTTADTEGDGTHPPPLCPVLSVPQGAACIVQVRNLSSEVDERALYERFEAYGEVYMVGPGGSTRPHPVRASASRLASSVGDGRPPPAADESPPPAARPAARDHISRGAHTDTAADAWRMLTPHAGSTLHS